ncbi:MAG: hypothetical protein P8J55_07020, partial [Pseudomonadales bacterium]|nr:hypothetical protein [Pseudomonadales bacterium]
SVPLIKFHTDIYGNVTVTATGKNKDIVHFHARYCVIFENLLPTTEALKDVSRRRQTMSVNV